MKLYNLILLIPLLTLLAANDSFAEELKVRRNPFEFGQKVQFVKSSVDLILISPNEKIAIINGKRYKVGDKVGKQEIFSITLGYVELGSGTKRKRLYVNERVK